ncbi:MAG: sigma-70 family RNA polymerase sigma factor [Candidatus Omnitrophica bacterium]|nr:sigma-70 family RNA polymerase sigma factor [Candidatus Omnitrophota bacterium]MCM8800328.1 sigma-70 family RNA polymerase sigma factor [Candidatus Omnitrophota bacterium]
MNFEDLLEKIGPRLKRITYKLNGHSSYINDEDLYQEALIYLWVKFSSGKFEDKTESYILQGCYFHLKNYLRKINKRMSLVSIESLTDDEAMNSEEKLLLKDSESYFDYLDCKILLEEIENDCLTKREREVLSLCLEGLTVREIGKRLGVSHARIVKIKANIKRKSNFLL